jgi:hypothetical protein
MAVVVSVLAQRARSECARWTAAVGIIPTIPHREERGAG